MLIYRVENADGLGPYDSSETDFLNRFSSPEHPSPYNDGLAYGNWTKNHVFGFENIASMKNWFSKDIRIKLRASGFLIGVYKMDARKLAVNGKIKHTVFVLHKDPTARDGKRTEPKNVYFKNVIKGGKQLVFYREFAEQVKRLDVMSLKEIAKD